MILLQSCTFLLILLIRSSTVFAQTTSIYTTYQTSFPYVTSCSSDQYFDTAVLRCLSCPNNTRQMLNVLTQCDCTDRTYHYSVNQGGGSLICQPCPTNYVRSSDGFGCVLSNGSCNSLISNIVISESEINGSLYLPVSTSSSQPRIGSDSCINCEGGTWPEPDSQRCVPCASVTPRTERTEANISCCTANSTEDGMCLTYVTDSSISDFSNQNRFSNPTSSLFIQQHLKASFFLCRMNLNRSVAQASSRLLLSNATACQLLANIAAMQLYYGATGYAYDFYDSYIWDSRRTRLIWEVSTNRVAIPFLAYPSEFYDEVYTTTYNWIPANFKQNDLMKLKLAKYSSSGQFLGLVDAFDSYIHLCGGGYTDGKAAFTFGAHYKKSCNIRVDALWNSTLYETAFYDPYIVFNQNGTDYMLPTPVVITNYQTLTGSYPNQDSDESLWIYYRRFFLLDRLSGITTDNESKNIRYAKSIKIVTELTNEEAYITPPLIIIEYDELSSSQIGTGTLVQVTFESIYRMNLSKHIMDIWIAFGVLAVLGIVFAFFRTTAWHSRAGKSLIDLQTIGKLLIYICNILATIFFIIMSGVSLWWLIFFKRQDTISLVMPTSKQQVSFTALVVLAFSLKTFDIIHLIFRQATTDLFFIDWEKPKSEKKGSVSIWRTYFVANEFQEIQTFRRIDVVFQLFFVLFLLKVINLENVATMEPGVNLFPSSADYKPEFSGILRVGIAFSMWLSTALVQYLFYVIFYQRFIEDKLLNFIDLCSVSNISVFILSDFLYGYYIHGLSPHGKTEVNMKDMLLNFERESNQMSATRGLQAKSDEQTFILRLDRKFRFQYTQLLRNYQTKMNNRTMTRQVNQNDANIIMESYRQLNEFLCAFINHSLPQHDYIIRNRSFLEKLLSYEFENSNQDRSYEEDEQSVFFVDKEQNFKSTMFSGHENSLFIWNAATFLFFDYFATNYVLAAIITYLLNLVAIKMRLSLGRKNMAAKTLIPKNFLL